MRIVNEYYQAVDDRNIAALVQLFTPDCVYERPGYTSIIGRKQLERFYSEDREIVTGNHTLNSVICQAEHVAVEGTFAGSLRDGTDVRVGFSDFFQLRDGLICHRRTYFFVPSI